MAMFDAYVLMAPVMPRSRRVPENSNSKLDAAYKILADATKEYFLKLANQQDVMIIEDMPS